MKYRIAYADTTAGLESVVFSFIKEGWKPQGGVLSGKELLLQAMVKDD